MFNRLTARLEQCRKASEQLLGNETCIIDGIEYKTTASTLSDGAFVDFGGQWPSVKFSLKFRRSELENPPPIDSLIEFRNQVYKVINIRYAPDNQAFTLDIAQL